MCPATIGGATASLTVSDGPGAMTAGAVLISGALALWRIGRISLTERGEAVVIRNFFSSRTVSWESIDAVEVQSRWPSQGPSAAISFIVSGRHLSSSATLTYSQRTAERICTAVEARAAVHQVPSDLSAAKLAGGF